jgi:glycosyltransferase involved in cell wall biosynthesis
VRIVIDLQGAQTDTRFHGIGRYSVDFSLALTEIAAADHEVWLLVNTAYPDSARLLRAMFAPWVPPERVLNFVPPVPLEADVYDDRPMRTAAELIWAHLLRSVEPDCVLVTSLIYSLGSDVVTCMSDRDAAPDLESRTAMIVYDLIPWLRPEMYLTDPITHRFYTDKLPGMQAAGLLLAISESSRQEALDHLGADPDRVVAISSAASDQFSPAPTDDSLAEARHDPRSTLGITRPFIMYSPSGIDPRKNNEGLIEAFAQLPPGLRDTHQLVITSRFTPSDHERLRIAARRAGLRPDDLILTGYVSDADLIALYRTTELFVYPSIHEGFGLPVLEAMACGAPVIGSNRTSVPEIIGRDDALFDPTSIPAITEAIAHALHDDAFRNALRTHGLIQAQQFSWESTAARALDAMTSVFAETPRITARDDDALLRDLVALLASHPDLLPRAAQAVADSLHRPDHTPQVYVDITGAEDLADAAELSPSILVDVRAASEHPQLVRRSDPPTLVDLRPGDTLVVARAENVADAQLRTAYEAAQAHGVRVAVPLASTDALVDALALLRSLDAGIFCADDRTHRTATRACVGRDIAVRRVDGRDVRMATVGALIKNDG